MHAEDRRAGEGAWPRRLMYVCIEPQLKPQPPPLRSPHILPLLQATAPHTVYCPGNPFRRPRWSLRPRRERRLRGSSRGRRRMRRRRRRLPARRRRLQVSGRTAVYRGYPPVVSPPPASRVSTGGISSEPLPLDRGSPPAVSHPHAPLPRTSSHHTRPPRPPCASGSATHASHSQRSGKITRKTEPLAP